MKDKTKEIDREKILSKLRGIVESARAIDNEMKCTLHEKTITYRTLEPQSTIIYDKKGFMAEYQHTDGKLYRIQIHELTKK